MTEFHGWCLNGNCGRLLVLDKENWKICPRHGKDIQEKPTITKRGKFSGASKRPYGGYENE